MALTPGSRIGVFQLGDLIGRGGMGEVYQATDTKLKRQVAIKILPPSLVADHDRLARFQREAEVLASLNHPNIAAIYGLEESDGITALVMELVEGDDLSQRIARGAIPIDEALPIAKQIAEALEAAHERNIIHRDLKPANIKIRADGTVKVLDFGLAKALDVEAGGVGGPDRENVSQAATLTAPAMTHAGMILGTAAYMSPEQARGIPVDRRADIWAFGAVFYEVLTGTRLFAAQSVAETLGLIFSYEPDLKALPRGTLMSIRSVLLRCLTKDLRTRLQAIGEARIAIERAIVHPQAEVFEVGGNIRRPMWRRAVPWIVAATFAAGLAVALLTRAASPPAPRSLPVRLSAELGADVSLAPAAGLALSPDGSLLAFVGDRERSTQLYVRRLGGLQATALPGTAGALHPFFAPDGEWVGFFADGKLKKVAVAGGEVVTLCDVSTPDGGWWDEHDDIIFASNSPRASYRGLQRVPASGGTPESFTTMGQGEAAHGWPQVLPGARAVVYTSVPAGGSKRASITSFEDASIVLQPLPAGPPRVLVRGGYHARYLPSGHLVYVHEGRLFGVPFDLGRLEISGQPAPALEGLSATPDTGGAQYAVSAAGSLVYLPAQSPRTDAPIVWMDTRGGTTPLRAAPSDWSNPHFSPDGTKLAIDIFDDRQGDVWVYEWARDALTRVTADPANDSFPVWTPDGRRVTFASTRGDGSTLNLYWQDADGSREAERLTNSPHAQLPGSWHPTGKYLVFQENALQTALDILVLPMVGDDVSGWKPGTPTAFLSTPFNEAAPEFSPDGKWIAYHSNESGATEVYVRPFPGPGGKWLISTSGGTSPTWSPTRHELFYRNVNNQIMVVPYTVDGNTLRADKPRLWAAQAIASRPRQRPFNLHPDGERFAVAIPAEEVQRTAKQDRAVFFLNFSDELLRTDHRQH